MMEQAQAETCTAELPFPTATSSTSARWLSVMRISFCAGSSPAEHTRVT